MARVFDKRPSACGALGEDADEVDFVVRKGREYSQRGGERTRSRYERWVRA